MVTVSLLLIVGSATSQDAALPKDGSPMAAPASRKAAVVATEAPELKRLVGSYTLIANQADSANVINNAIDAATASMNGLIKAVARKRLETVNKVVTRPGISSDQNNVTVGMNDYVVAAPLDGSTTDVKTPSGEIAKIKGCQSTFPANIREKCALTPFC
jgi:hypothetical protein